MSGKVLPTAQATRACRARATDDAQLRSAAFGCAQFG